MEFPHVSDFRACLREWAIKNGYDLIWKRNNSTRITVECAAQNGFPFYVGGAWKEAARVFKIVSLCEEHTYERAMENSQVSAPWLANKYIESFRDDPNWNVHVFISAVNIDFGVTINKQMTYRARRMALDEVDGKHVEQYSRLWDYANTMLKIMPDTTVVIKTENIVGCEDKIFYGMFVCFGALVKGMLNGCRKIIGMDGCHLKTVSGGVLLTACSRDPNNQMWPIAWAVVGMENKDTWTWFLTNLIEAIGVVSLRGWTFISDRQKVLLETFKELVPEAQVRYCVRHLYANFVKKFRGLDLKGHVWAVARSYTKHGWESSMEKMLKIDKEVAKWWMDIGPDKWARSHFQDSQKCDLLCNNICEAWNKYVMEARDCPIITLLEKIRRLVMVRLQKKREMIAKYTGIVTPKIREKLKSQYETSRACFIFKSSDTMYEIMEHGSNYCVDVEARSCDCGEWQLSGVVCRHAVVCLNNARKSVEEYCDTSYSRSTYVKVYEGTIDPVPDSLLWKRLGYARILPPKLRRPSGRPPKARKKDSNETKKKNPQDLVNMQRVGRGGYKLKCTRCQQFGHNIKKCKNDAAPPPPERSPKKGGRPKGKKGK